MEARACDIAAGFLDHSGRTLFHLMLRPFRGEARGAFLFLHPFAEEMNLARSNVAAFARQLAAAGYLVMQPDLTGCGDSSGDFVDATWELWCEDAAIALQHLRSLESSLPIGIWGLRTGALLACDVARREAGIRRLLLWQPVLNGEQQIDQFLRLRIARAMADSKAGFDRNSLWGQLRAGSSLEIAGYELSSGMALGISRLRLHDLVPACEVDWVEICAPPAREISPPSQKVVKHWRDCGVTVRSGCVPGEPLWRIHDAPLNESLQQFALEMLS